MDNFGDIGVCWRLARELAVAHGVQPRLWVDDLPSARRLIPSLEPALAIQHRAGVEIRAWTDPLPAIVPGDVVIGAFACSLPAGFLEAMAEFIGELNDLFGGFKERAKRVEEVLRGKEVAFVLVTSAAPPAIRSGAMNSRKASATCVSPRDARQDRKSVV